MNVEPTRFFFDTQSAPADLFQNPNTPTPKEIADELVQCTFAHWDFESKIKIGILIMHSGVVRDIERCLDLAFNIEFPFSRCCPISEYSFNDMLACLDNASTGHNMRNFQLSYNVELSKHATGTALDINPMLNPCWDIDRENPLLVHKTYPAGASYFPERIGSLYRVHPIVVLLKGLGWAWGGDWGQPEDRMHFQKVLPAHAKFYGNQ